MTDEKENQDCTRCWGECQEIVYPETEIQEIEVPEKCCGSCVHSEPDRVLLTLFCLNQEYLNQYRPDNLVGNMSMPTKKDDCLCCGEYWQGRTRKIRVIKDQQTWKS